MVGAVEDMIKVGELVHMYHLKESKEYGYYELVPWERKTRIIKGLPSSFKYWKSRFFFVSGDDFETPCSREWGDVPGVASSVGDPNFRCVNIPSCSKFSFCLLCSSLTPYLLFCVVKRRPKLKSRYNERIEKAIEYALTIES